MIAALFLQLCFLILFKEYYHRQITNATWQRGVYAIGIAIFGAEAVATATYFLWRYLP